MQVVLASALAQNPPTDPALRPLLAEGEGWQVVADNLQFCDGPNADAHGNFYFSEMRSTPPVIWCVSPQGQKTKLIEGTIASASKFGPDGRLYACASKEKLLVVFELPGGKRTVLATEVQPNDLVVSHRGHIYFTETGKKQVTFLDPHSGEKKGADVGITAPNGIALSPDQQTLAVSDSKGTNVWTFRIEKNGSLSAKTAPMVMRTPIDTNATPTAATVYKTASGGDGMTADTQGRYYVSSWLGVQVFAPSGEFLGILANPGTKNMTSAGFAGPNLEYLYVTCGYTVFRRKMSARGFLYYQAPLASVTEKK